MHPVISHQLAQARMAGLRQHAQRDIVARAARRARSAGRGHAASGWSAPGRRVRRRPSPQTVLAIAALGSAVAFVDITIVNIAFPDIARSFPGTSIATLSWVLNAYNIVFAAFLMAAAGLADRLGRRRVFVVGLQLFTAGSLACAIAPSADALIAFRVVQALGAAFLVPSALALVLNAFPPARRAHGIALLSAVGAGAAGLGPSLGGLLVTAASWRLVFVINIPIGVAAALLARRWLAESRAPGRRIPDLPGTLLFAIATGALVLGVVKGQDWGWGSVRTVGCLTAALAFGAVVIWRCSWHRSPVLDLSLLRIRAVSVANAMMVIGAAGFYGYTLSNVLFLTSVWRYSVLQAGLALTVGPVVAVAVAGPASRLAQRIGPRPVLVAGGLLWGGAVLWFVERVGATPDFAGQWLPGMVLLGIGAGTLFPVLSGTAVAAAPGESFATATGLNSVARQVGAALGVAVVVAIIGTPTPATAYTAFHVAWTFGAICLFAAGLGCLLVGRLKTAGAPPGDAALAVLAGTQPRRALPPSRPRRVVALIAVDGQIPPWRLATRLCAALQAHVSVAVLGGAEVPGTPVPSEPAGVYGPLLDRAEAGHDLVLLSGGFTLREPWTRFCLQHADRILAVTSGGPVPPALGHHPELQGCDLVAYDATPGALTGWAAALDPAGSHVIRETELDADIARLARRLAGTSASLVA